MNKFKILKSTLALAASFALFMPFVSADAQEYYTNQNGLVMPMEDYEYLLEKTSVGVVELLDQQDYELLMNDVTNYKVVMSDTKYIMTTTIQKANGEISSLEKEITKEEYDNFEPIMPMSSCSTGLVCWETNAKKYYMVISEIGNDYNIMGVLDWKTIPKVLSYDINAIRWESSGGTFVPKSSGVCAVVDADSNWLPNSQLKKFSNGFGGSTLLKSGSQFQGGNIASVTGYFTDKTITQFYGTYQHATQNVTLAQSMSYTLNANGLGGSIYFSDANIRNSYDNMTGLYFTVNDYV